MTNGQLKPPSFATLAPHCVWCSAGEHPVDGGEDAAESMIEINR